MCKSVLLVGVRNWATKRLLRRLERHGVVCEAKQIQDRPLILTTVKTKNFGWLLWFIEKINRIPRIEFVEPLIVSCPKKELSGKSNYFQ